MSLFSWFSKPTSSDAESPAQPAGSSQDGAGVSSSRPQAGKVTAPPLDPSASRKTERIERREQLYAVVRDAMTRAGILSTGYKFKVLSLDPRGKQYLIMMDLSDQSAGEAARLAEIEALIAQLAKTRHEVLVTAVYWRVNANVTVGLSSARPGSGASGAASRPAPLSVQPPSHPALPVAAAAVGLGAGVAAVAVAGQAPRYEPLQEDEVMAFKNALASAAPAGGLVASGEIVKSGRRNPAQPQEFENTELLDHDEKVSPLSTTQYGDLD
jgi:hypothetical protein